MYENERFCVVVSKVRLNCQVQFLLYAAKTLLRHTNISHCIEILVPFQFKSPRERLMDSNMIQTRNIKPLNSKRKVKDDYELGAPWKNVGYTVVLNENTTVKACRSTVIVNTSNSTFYQSDIRVQLEKKIENAKLQFRKKYVTQTVQFFKMRLKQAALNKLQKEQSKVADENLLEKMKKPMNEENRERFKRYVQLK